MAGNLKFVGKPPFKSKRTYYIFLACMWLATVSVIVLAYFCYYRWDSPTYVNVILWGILALLAGGGVEVYFHSYEKYKNEFMGSDNEAGGPEKPG